MRTSILLLFLSVFSLVSSAQTRQQRVDPLLLYKVMQDEQCQRWVDSLMNKLSMKEKVGQLFVYTIAPTQTKHNLALLREAVVTHKVGGLLFSGGLLQNQVALTNSAQSQACTPLLITFDGEWGLSMRLRNTPVFPRNMVLGCIQDNRLIYEYGREMARQCREIGVQVNFAPVADVNVNPSNPVINTRSFGQNPVKVAEKVIAYASGLEGGGVLSVCKHFPGHGDTDVDSHKALPVLPFTRERLDSVELYPFKEAIDAGLSGMMVGHLHVPAVDSIANLPSSLSRNIVHHLLTKELAFKGLIFTDALAMRGVSGNASVSLQALKAGNDIVLSPRNIKEELAAVYRAVNKGELSINEVNLKCRKVLMYKYALGLQHRSTVRLSGLAQRIDRPETGDLIRKLNLAAITVINNKNQMLPLHSEVKEVALLEVGGIGKLDTFANRLSKYTSPIRFRLDKEMTAAQSQQLLDSLAAYKRIIVAVGEQKLRPYQSFFNELESSSSMLYVFFTPSKAMMQIESALSAAQAVVLAHTATDDVQNQVGDVLFAKATADGRLSSDIGELFLEGSGVTITPETPAHFIPEEHGLRSEVLARIDSIALKGIEGGAYPGCQVVVLKDGYVMYDRSFGTFSGADSEPVTAQSMYDLASLSKTTGTLLALMKLYDKGRFNLTDKLSDYLPWLLRTNKKEITIREVLLHQSGLPAGISLYGELIDKSSYRGRLFSTKRDVYHTLKLGRNTWANPQFKFRKEYVSRLEKSGFTLPISQSLWLNSSFPQVVEQEIAKSTLRDKTYRYSDVGFILLRLLVEQLSDMPMDEFLQQEFFEPMKLEHTGYNPLKKFTKKEIVPSAVDRFLRKDTLRGYVHDECAALQGGISGNAGLFSTAKDVARVHQMLLNQGELDGKRYLSEETSRLFTSSKSSISRRGLGFDRPDTKEPKKSPCALVVPASVYGHTGFTGTCAWVDPDNRLVYVFLSNRIYPDPTNKKLQELAIRESIQGVLYEAIQK